MTGGSCCAGCWMIIWRCGRCASSAWSRSSAMRGWSRSAGRARSRPRAWRRCSGPCRVERLAYRAPGVGNLHPADAALNLPVERHSHGLRKLAALESPRGSFEDAVEAIERQTGQRLGKRQVEELAGLAAMDFEDFYEARRPARSKAGRSVGALGRRQGDRDAPRRAAHPRPGQAPRGPRAQAPAVGRGAASTASGWRRSARSTTPRRRRAPRPTSSPPRRRRAMSPPRGRSRATSGCAPASSTPRRR